jgi:hypothetical protein
VGGAGEVVVSAIFPFFSQIKSFDRGVSAASVRVANESRFEEADEVEFVCRRSHNKGEYIVRENDMARDESVGREAFVSKN